MSHLLARVVATSSSFFSARQRFHFVASVWCLWAKAIERCRFVFLGVHYYAQIDAVLVSAVAFFKYLFRINGFSANGSWSVLWRNVRYINLYVFPG